MTDMHTLSSYFYELPEELIAQQPKPRGSSRLLVMDRCTGAVQHKMFADIANILPADALLVANNSRVIPVRLLGNRVSGGKMECLLLTPLPIVEQAGQADTHGMLWAEADVLLKPSKAMSVGTELLFGSTTDRLAVEVLVKGEFGQHRVRLGWKAEQGGLRGFFERNGHLPLPPYIRRPDTTEDLTRYQTVFARQDKAGSAAAPTAGLHFTDTLRAALREKGVEWAEVTLHVGYGTFSPVRCADIREHHMHSECIECPPETALAVRTAREQGRPVIAVGTTACRTLEGIASLRGHVEAFVGSTNIFMYPGYRFRAVDGLITNFHLPESTLLMLVCAFAGFAPTLAAYQQAVAERYRFFSYGDAMFIR